MLEYFKGIEINKINPVGEDPRGPTYEWCKGIPGIQLTVCKRHKGVVSGNHYHKGDDPSKNPERLLLVNGNFKLIARNDMAEKHLEAIINEGDELIIHPGILHSFEALTDITFLEYRQTIFNKACPDTYAEDTYSSYISQLRESKR
ncbi:MAG: hypothetical protein AABW50_02130 [Nanoarchaeota archaeon]|mgnify:CR=1 FL=1